MRKVLVPVLFWLSPRSVGAFLPGMKPKGLMARHHSPSYMQPPVSSSSQDADIMRMEPGQVLLPSSPEDPTQFDAACVVNPVVLCPTDTYDKWQLYYYGNHDGLWNDGSKGFLPSGWCGLAESDDGIHWTKIVGPLEQGAILAPSNDPVAWDSVHVGVGDVVRVNNNNETEELHMYYFGGSREMVPGLFSAGSDSFSFSGIRMRIGRARSLDRGRTWERLGIALDYEETEGLFASWPRILRPKENGSSNEKPWQMLYHTFDGSKWRVFGATSSDQGETWTRKGLILEGSDDGNSFDCSGIGTRAVVSPWKGGALMIYEGVDGVEITTKHRLGAAFCSDVDGDGPWEKIRGIKGCSQPGGPIAAPGEGAMGSWTSMVIGTPYIVQRSDGSLLLYHCGKQQPATGHAIGLLISDSGEIHPEAWRPHC